MNIKKLFYGIFISGIIAAGLNGCASSPTKESTGQVLDDSVITAKVKTALLNAENVNSSDISVETFKGVVQLSGFVSSRQEEWRAAGVARKVDGVKSVDNDMQVK